MSNDEQIQSIESLTVELVADLDEIKQDFEGRRRLIETLNVQARLNVEDGHKVTYAEYMLGEKLLSINCKKAYVDVN